MMKTLLLALCLTSCASEIETPAELEQPLTSSSNVALTYGGADAVVLYSAMTDETSGLEDSSFSVRLRYQGSAPVETFRVGQGGDLFVEAHGTGNEGPSIKFSTDSTGHGGSGGGQFGYHRPLGGHWWGRLADERFYVGTHDTPRMEVSPAGHVTPYDDTLGTYDGDYDLGKTALRWRNLYLSDSVWLDVSGTMQQVKIGASGTGPGGSGRALYLD